MMDLQNAPLATLSFGSSCILMGGWGWAVPFHPQAL
jgi:hypothetical protein